MGWLNPAPGPMLSQVNDALELIREALCRASRPYVAFSGGKDSLVLAHLVHRVDPSIQMVYSDDELLLPEHVAYIRRMIDRGGLRIVSGGSIHAGWFRPWESAPYWRDPEPEMEWLPRNWKGARGRLSLLARTLGYDGAFIGLRRLESRRRAAILEGSTGVHMAKGYPHITPIADWDDADVWEYIARHQLPYCHTYDRMAEIGVQKPRLGPLPLMPGKYLWKGWPDLYLQIIQRYGPHWQLPTRRPSSMSMLTWLDLHEGHRYGR